MGVGLQGNESAMTVLKEDLQRYLSLCQRLAEKTGNQSDRLILRYTMAIIAEFSISNKIAHTSVQIESKLAWTSFQDFLSGKACWVLDTCELYGIYSAS